MQVAEFLHSRKWMYRTGWGLYVVSLPWAISVAAAIIQWKSYFPERISAIHFAGLIVLTLALFSNLVLFASRVAWRPVPPRTVWRVLLLTFLVLNASLVCFLPDFARLPGYWLWLAGFAVLTWGLLFVPPAPKTKSGRPILWQPGGADDSDGVQGVVWAGLAVTIFWLAVTVVNYYDGRYRHRHAVAAAPNDRGALTSYVTDSAKLFPEGDLQGLTASLAAFERATSNQIAVAIYPHLPAEPIEDFTIRVAEASHLGGKNRDNGVILFIFPAERVARIEVGYGLEGVLPDSISRRILATELAPQFSKGAYREGIERTVAAIGERVETEFGSGDKEGLPAFLARLYPQLKVAVIKVARNAWPLTRDSPLEARMGISFFGTLLAFGVWSAIVNAAKLLWSTAMGVWNLIRHRPFKHGMLAVDFEPIWDTVKLAAFFAIIAGSYVAVAGGGAFGGAGAVIHWAGRQASRIREFL